jgi:hypothetical protein
MEPNPYEAPKSGQGKPLWQRLVYFPGLVILAVMALAVSLITALVLTCTVYNMPGNRPGDDNDGDTKTASPLP